MVSRSDYPTGAGLKSSPVREAAGPIGFSKTMSGFGLRKILRPSLAKLMQQGRLSASLRASFDSKAGSLITRAEKEAGSLPDSMPAQFQRAADGPDRSLGTRTYLKIA